MHIESHHMFSTNRQQNISSIGTIYIDVVFQDLFHRNHRDDISNDPKHASASVVQQWQCSLSNGSILNIFLLISTILYRALRRKNALQDSHEIASKLYPCARP
jgi:hypothetical protein